MYRAIEYGIERGTIIVISTRVTEGHVLPAYSFLGGGVTLERLGVIFASDLSPWKARILLMLAMGTTINHQKIQDYFSY